MRALVTGASGFVGANLARRLLESGHEVHVLLRPNARLWRLEDIYDSLHVHSGDMNDADRVAAAVAQSRPEWIMHLAVYGAYAQQANLDKMIQTNMTGTANLLHACRKIGFSMFINTGSSSEYGLKSHAPSENEVLEPNSYYAISKAAATHLCTYEAQRHSLPIVTLRLYSVYGAWEEPGRLMPTLLRYASEKRYPPLVSPETARDFVYLDDVLDAYLKVAQSSGLPFGAIYNIGSGKQSQLRNVVREVSALYDIQDEPVWATMPQRHWDTYTWVANIDRAKNELGWYTRYDLKLGLQKMAAWMQSHLELYPLAS